MYTKYTYSYYGKYLLYGYVTESFMDNFQMEGVSGSLLNLLLI